MSGFLDAAYEVLRCAESPLTAPEITHSALELGLLSSSGQTPQQTMKSKLSIDILRHKDRSRFMRTEQGHFALREWKGDLEEYVAERYQKALLDEDAVVFDVGMLDKFGIQPGLVEAPLEDGYELLASCRPMLRRAAEEDTTVVQLVSAFVIKYLDRYLTYKRSARLPESRLRHQYSVLFGGHLTPDDVFNGGFFTVFTPDDGLFLLERELDEELRIHSTPEFHYRGLLYDTRRDLSRQHLGIVYDVELAKPDYQVGERGFLIDDKFETLEEITSRIEEFENWSELIIRTERKVRQ